MFSRASRETRARLCWPLSAEDVPGPHNEAEPSNDAEPQQAGCLACNQNLLQALHPEALCGFWVQKSKMPKPPRPNLNSFDSGPCWGFVVQALQVQDNTQVHFHGSQVGPSWSGLVQKQSATAFQNRKGS